MARNWYSSVIPETQERGLCLSSHSGAQVKMSVINQVVSRQLMAFDIQGKVVIYSKQCYEKLNMNLSNMNFSFNLH